jgi:TolA-binding protein
MESPVMVQEYKVRPGLWLDDEFFTCTSEGRPIKRKLTNTVFQAKQLKADMEIQEDTAVAKKAAKKDVKATKKASGAKKAVDKKTESKVVSQETKPEEKNVAEEKQMPQVTLQASRRFWLLFLGSAILILAVVQGYGYFTGWGNPQKVIQRQFNTAQRLTLAKRYKAAIRQYTRIIKVVTDEEVKRQASIALADLYREQKEWTKAITLYKELQTKDTGTVMAAWTGLKIAEAQHESGSSAEALETYADIRVKHPKSDWDAEARLGIGKVLMDQKKYQEAIVMYRTLENEYQGGFLAAEALVHIGECYEKLGNAEVARKTFQMILDTYPATMTDEAKKKLNGLDGTKKPEGVRLWGE